MHHCHKLAWSTDTSNCPFFSRPTQLFFSPPRVKCTTVINLRGPLIHQIVPDAHFNPQSRKRDKQLHKLVLRAQFDTSAGEVMTCGTPSQQHFCKKTLICLAFSVHARVPCFKYIYAGGSHLSVGMRKKE
jgi:hypothetical protein